MHALRTVPVRFQGGAVLLSEAWGCLLPSSGVCVDVRREQSPQTFVCPCLQAPPSIVNPFQGSPLTRDAHRQAATRARAQGTSRYEVMLQPMKPLRYTHLHSCGHTAFTGPPLPACLEVAGAPLVDLWVASSDADADVFAYLEDVNPASGKARWVPLPSSA